MNNKAYCALSCAKKGVRFNLKSLFSNPSRWLITLLAIFTIGVGQMWADNAGINTLDGANVNLLVDGVERIDMNCSNTGTDPYSATTIVCSSLILEKAYIRTWKNNSNGNICTPKIYWHIWRANESGGYDGWQTGWTDGTTLTEKSNKSENGQTKQEWANESLDIDVTEGLPEGRYVFEYNFQVTGSNSANNQCSDIFYYNNGSNHYRIPFVLKRSCTVESDICANVFLFDALGGMTINSWKSGCCGTSAQNIYSGGAGGTNYFDRIGNYFVFGIKNGEVVDANFSSTYETFKIENSANSNENTGEKNISDHAGNFYKYTNWTISESQAYECPVKITRSHYGPIWGDALTMTFKLKNWTNLEGGSFTISSPEPGVSIVSGASGSITSSQGETTCAIQLPSGDSRADGDVEIDFDYTVNHVTFKVKTYIHVFRPKVIKVYDTRGFKNIYVRENTQNDEAYHKWPGILQESLGNNWYIVRINPHGWKFWLNNGSSNKQTYSDGITITWPTDGNVYELKTDNGDASCYLADYTGVTLWRIKSFDGTNTYYSNAVAADATGDDAILSFYADLNNASATYQLQSMAANSTTWNDGASIPKTRFTNVYDGATAAKPGNVFVAKLNSATPTDLTDVAVYDRDLGFKIHCGASTANYLTHGVGSTAFTYFEPNPTIFPGEKFDYYWVDWFEENETVVASVGNAYNDNLAHIIGIDAYAPDGVAIRTGEESKFHGGNFRFGYNPETNYFSRTVVGGSGGLIKIKGERVNPASAGYGEETTFSDASSWVYTVNAVVKGKATATITTAYNYVDTKLATDQQLIGGSADSDIEYTVLITYDFKTNRLLAAWQPSGAFDGFDLESNLMIVRTENDPPTVLNIVDGTDEGTVADPLTKITKVYTVIELLQDHWISTATPYSARPYAKRRIVTGDYIDEYYWISLPYECLVSDIFGIEGYGNGESYNDSWVLQTYRGDLRAQTGWWAETDAWWYDMDRTDTLKANEGYVLRVTNLNGENGLPKRFAGESGGKLYLYFPSEANDTTIGLLTGEVKTHLDSLKCTKWHKVSTTIDEKQGENNPIWDRRAIDSNWRIIGSPSFNSTKVSAPEFITDEIDNNPADGYISLAEQQAAIEKYIEEHDGATPYSLKYFYNWEVVSDGYTYSTKFTIANAATTQFIGTHAHLVQYAGDITWVAYDGSNPLVGLVPNPIAAPARTNDDEISMEQTLRLVLKKDGNDADVAYISRMLFGATTGYDINMDLSKMTNANSANIYTYGDLYKMAGNCLPDTISTVQVGVQLAAAGDYTFAMPDGTYGTGVVLVDKLTNTRTNLALTDYTVTLDAGETNERFYLELSPIAQTPTGIEPLSPILPDANVRKIMIDGVLYIVRDGKVFDARGARVQ